MDESRFNLESDNRRYLIWRKLGTRYYPSNIRERYACGRGRVCIWGGFCLGGRRDLHIFPRGIVNAEVYRDDILDVYAGPYAEKIGDIFLLQGDNARPHGAHIIDDHLQRETILRMERLAQSSDFNPIENH